MLHILWKKYFFSSPDLKEEESLFYETYDQWCEDGTLTTPSPALLPRASGAQLLYIFAKKSWAKFPPCWYKNERVL